MATTASTTPRYWLTQAKQAMEENGYGCCWLPGTIAWQWYMPDLRDPQRAIRHAQRRGFLTTGPGIPHLTQAGYDAS